jgi:predicted component of type VI protein secretion system
VSRKLVVSDGTRDRELQLVGRLVVGRDPNCDISHDHALLSRRHAEFVTAGDSVTVRDLGSRNGVFVNGARAAERVLEPGDIVQIGPLRARYVADASAPGIAPEEMDVERTVVIREPSAAPSDRAVPAPAPAEPIDDDVTRLVRGPRMPPPPPSSAAVALLDDDVQTGFIPGPVAAARIAAAEAAASAAPTHAAEATVPAVREDARRQAAPSSMGGFVFAQVFLLAVVVFAAAALPLAWNPAAAGMWLVVRVAVAALAAAFVGAALNRRFTRALGERDRIRG